MEGSRFVAKQESYILQNPGLAAKQQSASQGVAQGVMSLPACTSSPQTGKEAVQSATFAFTATSYLPVQSLWPKKWQDFASLALFTATASAPC